MKLKQGKKTLIFSFLAATALAATVGGLAIGLTSCSKTDQNSSKPVSPTLNTKGEFTSLFGNNLKPMVASVLTSQDGRNSITTSAANLILSAWFKNVNNPSLNADYQEWQSNAEENYKTKYNDYQKNKGPNWKQLFQQEVLDPVGGTKQAFIQNQIDQQLQNTFINDLFDKQYLGLNNKGQIEPITQGSGSLQDIDNPDNINGANGAGTLNNFTFSALTQSNPQAIDYGYADFMNYLMTSWVQNTLPLPISMSLWKNGDTPQSSGLFNQEFFGSDAIGDKGSYNFQYFAPATAGGMTLSTTDKFKLLIDGLNNGLYVNDKTGAIDLPVTYTEDSSTTMTIQASSLFDGSIALPFSAAALYKFENAVFGTTDSAMPTASSIDTSSIMKNFLVYNNGTAGGGQSGSQSGSVSGSGSGGSGSSSGSSGAAGFLATRNGTESQNSQTQPGVFMFPYPTTFESQQSGGNNTSVFMGEYRNAIGVKDTINLTGFTTTNQNNNESTYAEGYSGQTQQQTSANLNNFILTRDSFGVHLISIDRLSQIEAAVNGGSSSGSKTDQQTTPKTAYQKYIAACNEIRNTFMFRAAQDITNGTNVYKLQDSLKTYLQNNFATLIVNYAQKAFNENDPYNLFGANVVCGLIKNPSNDATTNPQDTPKQKVKAVANAGTESTGDSSSNNQDSTNQGSNSDQSTKPGLGEFGNQYTDYKQTLESIGANTVTGQFILASGKLNQAEAALKFVNNVRQQMYSNQSAYNNTTDPSQWKKYGIAGVLPYTRDAQSGNFNSLTAIVNDLIATTKPNATTPDNTKVTRNDTNNNPDAIVSGNATTVADPKTAQQLVTNAKANFENAVINYVNNWQDNGVGISWIQSFSNDTANGEQQVGQLTYLFTNNSFVNNAIQACSNSNQFVPIVQNFYMERYLTTQTPTNEELQIPPSLTKPSTPAPSVPGGSNGPDGASQPQAQPQSRASANIAKGQFYDYQSNTLWNSNSSAPNANTVGSTNWVKQQVQQAIDTNYMINNFTSLPNLYADGDWSTLTGTATPEKSSKDAGAGPTATTVDNGVWKIARQVWLNSWEASQYIYKNANGTMFVSYENPSSAAAYQKFLITVEYLLDYNAATDTFSFNNLVNFLNELTANNNRAMVAWANVSSIKKNANYGVNIGTAEANDINSVRSKINSDSQFLADPIYLTKITPYSWYGAPNYFTSSDSVSANQGNLANGYEGKVAWTNNSNYWFTAPMLTSAQQSAIQQKKGAGAGAASAPTTNTGFLGFQVNNSSQFGITNTINSAAFDNSTYTITSFNANSNSSNGGSSYAATPGENGQGSTANNSYAYLGTLYQFVSRTDMETYVGTLSTPNQLMDFYNQNLLNSGLPLTQASKNKMRDIDNGTYATTAEKVNALSQEILTILKDTNQVPDAAFQKMSALPLWNTNNGTTSTLFDTGDGSTPALKTEYVVSLFNAQDVKNLLTTPTAGKEGSSDSTPATPTLNTTDTGFLGLNPQAFFNAVVMLANNNTQLQSDAMKAMFTKLGSFKVYDQRLVTGLDSSWITNYQEWQPILNLGKNEANN